MSKQHKQRQQEQHSHGSGNGAAQPTSSLVTETDAIIAKQEAESTFVVGVNPEGLTPEEASKMSAEDLKKSYGNTSNAIRGLAALGLKPGPISKMLGIRYQHARNVLLRPLKRVIKAERDAKKVEAVTEKGGTKGDAPLSQVQTQAQEPQSGTRSDGEVIGTVAA